MDDDDDNGQGQRNEHYAQDDDGDDQVDVNDLLRDEDILEVIPLDEYVAGQEIGGGGDEEDNDDDAEQQSTSMMDMVETEAMREDAVCIITAHAASHAEGKDAFCVALGARRWLASGGENDQALLFDTHANDASQPILSIKHSDSVVAVAFNSSATLLASADMKGLVIITQTADLTQRCKIEDCSELEWMHWHSTADILLAGSRDGLVWMWLISGNGVAQSKVYSAGVDAACTSGALTPDGRRLLAGYEDGSLRLWNLKDQTSSAVNLGSSVRVVSIGVDASQNLGVAGCEDGTTHAVLMSQDAQQQPLRVVALFRDGLAATKSPSALDEDVESDVGNSCESAKISARGWAAVGRNDGSLAVYDLNTHSSRFICRSERLQALSWVDWTESQGAPYVLATGVDGVVSAWDARDGHLIGELEAGGTGIMGAAFLPGVPSRIFAACTGGQIKIFELPEQLHSA